METSASFRRLVWCYLAGLFLTGSICSGLTEPLAAKAEQTQCPDRPPTYSSTPGEQPGKTVAAGRAIDLESPRPFRIGLALGGGGTRGLAHAGVLKALDNAGIKIDCIAGTSMGAIVGAMYAAGRTPDEIYCIIRDKKFERAFDTVPIPLRVALIPVMSLPRLFGHRPYDGLYIGNRFAHFIDSCLPEDKKNIENLNIAFAAVACNLLDGKAYAIKSGSVCRAAQASSAIPGLRRPVALQDKLFVDAGVNNNVPVKQCKEMSVDLVIAVDVDERLVQLPKDHFRKIGSVSYRCLNMQLSKIDEPQLAIADMVIHPHVEGIELLSHKSKVIRAAFNAGEEAGKEAAPMIKQKISQALGSNGSPNCQPSPATSATVPDTRHPEE